MLGNIKLKLLFILLSIFSISGIVFGFGSLESNDDVGFNPSVSKDNTNYTCLNTQEWNLESGSSNCSEFDGSSTNISSNNNPTGNTNPKSLSPPSCTLSWSPQNQVQAGNRLTLSWSLSNGAKILEANCRIINENIIKQYISGNSLDFNPLPDYGEAHPIEEECSIKVGLDGSSKTSTCNSGVIKVTRNSCLIPEGKLSGPKKYVLPGNLGFFADSTSEIIYAWCNKNFQWEDVLISDCSDKFGNSPKRWLLYGFSAQRIFDLCYKKLR